MVTTLISEILIGDRLHLHIHLWIHHFQFGGSCAALSSVLMIRPQAQRFRYRSPLSFSSSYIADDTLLVAFVLPNADGPCLTADSVMYKTASVSSGKLNMTWYEVGRPSLDCRYSVFQTKPWPPFV